MAQRWKMKNPALHGREVTLRGGNVRIDAWGLLPVDISPEQFDHARTCGLFEAVDVTEATRLRAELALCRARLAEVEPSFEQARRVFLQWNDRKENLQGEIGQLEGELARLEALEGPEPEPAVPAPHIDVAGLSWDGLKDLARAHDVTIARRSRDEIQAELTAKLAAGADTKES